MRRKAIGGGDGTMNTLLERSSMGPDALRDPGPAALDRRQFAKLYREHGGAVLRFAWSLVHDEQLAEDICAEAFLRAWCSRDRFRGDGEPLAWLLSITRNCAMSEFRRRQRQEVDMNTKPESLADSLPDTTSPMDGAAAESRLREALHCLTEEQQKVIFLRFFERLDSEEVGSILGISANAVRAAQFRALSRLRQLLEVAS